MNYIIVLAALIRVWTPELCDRIFCGLSLVSPPDYLFDGLHLSQFISFLLHIIIHAHRLIVKATCV